jgi:uncharacterized membrane protein YcaP (DUF421 family)
MKQEDIKLWDWPRMLLGEVPPAFLLEIILRMAVVYVILMVCMRFLGKRMAAQYTRNEIAAMVSLAAAVGVPILAPDRGLLPAAVIGVAVVGISRMLAYFSAIDQKVEAVTQGSIDTLVKDGVIDVKAMTRTRITRERILAELRGDGIMHLGEVKRLYMEANGTFTIIKNKQARPGLPVIPDNDREFLRELKVNGVLVCHACGNTNDNNKSNSLCPNCNRKEWVRAVEI